MLVELLKASQCAADPIDPVPPQEPYRPRAGTTAAQVIEELRKLPPGGRMTTTRLSHLVGVKSSRLHVGATQSIECGYVVFHPGRSRNVTGSWALGSVPCPAFAPDRRRRAEMDGAEELPQVDEVSPELVSKLKESFYSAELIVTGDSLMLLAEALQAAREALARKEGGRFKGAEVDLFVARELRAISEAAMRARDNLRAAVAGML